MRGKASAELLFDAEPERLLRARLREVKRKRLASKEESPIVSESEDEERISIPPEQSESEPETMAADPPPPERLLGDYGRDNAPLGRMTIVNQPVNVAHFQLHPSTIRQLESKPFAGRINEDANKHLQRFLTTTTSLKIEGHSEEAKRLVMFPFTLSEDAEEWFYSLPAGSITTWQQMETAFLNEYFPASVFIRKRYDIVNFKQKEGESLGDAYKRFKRCLVACPTHNMDPTEQMQTFVNGLRVKTKQLIDTAAGGSTNFSTATGVKRIIEAIAANENIELYDRAMSQPKGKIDLKLTDQVVKMEEQIAAEVERRLKKMNIDEQKVAQVEPTTSVVCEICSGPHFAMHCVATQEQVEQIHMLRQNNPYANTYNPGWKNHPNFAWNDQQGNFQKQGSTQFQTPAQPQQQLPYQQQFQHHPQKFQQQVSKKEDWEIALEKVATQNSQFQEETRANLRNTTASIKNLEVQIGQIAQHLTLQAQGNFPNETVKDQKNLEKINAVTTRSKKVAESEKEKEEIDDPFVIEVDLEIRENVKEPEIVIPPVKQLEEKNKKDAKPAIKLPFPSRVTKKNSTEKDFEKFAALFKKLEVNLPFFEALEQMPLYKKFMKEVIGKKRPMGGEPEIATEKCSIVSPARKIPIKRKDPGAVAIPCTIKNIAFKKVLIDSGSSVSLMPLSIFKKLELGGVNESKTKLRFVDHTVKKSYGVAEDVLVEVDKFVFPVDFHIMDIPEDEETPILLGRPFLSTGRCNFDIEKGTLTLKSFDEEVTLKMLGVKKHRSGVNEKTSTVMPEGEQEDKNLKNLQEKVSNISSPMEPNYEDVKSPKKAKESDKNGEGKVKRKDIHAFHLHEFLVAEVKSNQVWNRKYPP